MDDLNAIANAIVAQGRARRGQGVFTVRCPACSGLRQTRASDWRKRDSDLCHPCEVRARVGLRPGGVSGKGTRLYNIWRNMRQRCGLFRGAKARDLAVYRERGITVCENWATSFSPFREWAEANGYASNLVLDRIDNSRGYEPGNCRWVTTVESNRNRTITKLTHEQVAEIRRRIAEGGRGIQTRLAREYGVSDGQISVIKSGKSWANS